MAPHSTVDMLISLPQGILENIFSRLSIGDVVRTSVLSTNWRNKWISFPHLIFDDHCAPFLDKWLDDDELDDEAVVGDIHNKFVKIVNHVRLIHKDPILTFDVSNSFLQSCSEIDSWILSLSSNSLEEFYLHISLQHNPYKVTQRLFSFKNLIHLRLINCFIIPPPLTFSGFRVLKTLRFEEVDLSYETLEYLVSSCPELERLTLVNIYDIAPSHIELSNPKLKYLFICAQLIAVCHHDLKHMSYAYFDSSYDFAGRQWKPCNILIGLLRSLLCIQRLELGLSFLQYASRIDLPRKVLSTNHHLRSLSFYIEVGDLTQILIAICLLNSAHNLQDLTIGMCYDSKSPVSPKDLQKENSQLESTFKELQSVTISQLHGMEIELTLVKYILANSPILQTMRISTAAKCKCADDVFKQLIRFRRASPQAEVIL